jgi:hypothetical protein
LDEEDIGQIAIVVCAHRCASVPGIDQLRVHPHFIGGALHAAFDDMRHAQLLADLPQIARCTAFVLHHRHPTNHFEIRDLCEVGQDLVLTPSAEQGIAFSSLRFSNGRTAMLFSMAVAGEGAGPLRKKERAMAASAATTSSPIATAAQRIWA